MTAMRKLVLVAALLLAACARHDPGGATSPLLGLDLPPQSFGGDLRLTQQVTGTFDGERHSVRFETEIAGERLVMAAFTHLGVPLFVLEEDGSGIHFENLSGGELPFDPRFMLADFKIANWPTASLAPALAEEGLHLDNDAGTLRRVTTMGGTAVMEVRGSATDPKGQFIEHFDHPYVLEIVTLQGGAES